MWWIASIEWVAVKICRTCGQEKPRSEFPSSGKYTRNDGTSLSAVKPDCRSCHSTRQRNGQIARFAEIGVVWKCVRCGYDRCVAAIDFHHTNPADKDFNVGSRQCISKARLSEEVSKCIVICRNCHAELHDGMWDISELGD